MQATLTAPPAKRRGRRHSNDPDKPLTQRMRRFCRAYLEESTLQAAGVAAGYSPHTAQAQASALLRNVRITAEIARLRSDALKARGIDRSWVIDALVNIAGDEKVAGQARVRAIELIGKDLGLFASRTEVSAHVVVHRATPRLNPAPLSQPLQAALTDAMDAIEAEATLVSDPGVGEQGRGGLAQL